MKQLPSLYLYTVYEYSPGQIHWPSSLSYPKVPTTDIVMQPKTYR